MNTHTNWRKRRGQALLLIAGAIVGLVALVALAVDGGNAFAQRRIAQNAADGGAMAGATTMNQVFQSNRACCDGGGNSYVRPIAPYQNTQIRQAIEAALRGNGSTIDMQSAQVWWLDSNGQKYGNNQVGANESVRFASSAGNDGAAGVFVQVDSAAETYFARVIGVNNVRAGATGGALIGSPNEITGDTQAGGGPAIWPITIYTTTLHYSGSTVLYDFNNRFSPGNWGLLCFDGGNCGNNKVKDWFDNGFNPANGTFGSLEANGGGVGTGVNYHFFPLGWDGTRAGTTGFWTNVHTGNAMSASCDVIQHAGDTHRHVGIPVSDRDNGGNGSNLLYHVVNIAIFEVTYPTSHDRCGGNANEIHGNFVGFGIPSGSANWTKDLGKSVINGITTVRMYP